MRNRAPAADEAGFTLIEALIAIIILVFGLVAITNLMIVAASSNSVANQSTATAALATQELERLKSLTYAAPEMQPGGSLTADTTSGGINYFSDVNVDGVGPIHTRWQITAIAGDPDTRFIQVRSEPIGGLLRARARSEFTTFRSCTGGTALGCP